MNIEHKSNTYNSILELFDNNKGKIAIFYTEDCGYSSAAREYLKTNNIPYVRVDIDKITFANNPSNKRQEFFRRLSQAEIVKKTGYNTSHTSRPVIFYDGKFVGGYSELIMLDVKSIKNVE